MKKRVISAIIVIALLVACLFISDVTRIVFFAACAVLTIYEINKAMKAAGHTTQMWPALLTLLCAVLFMVFEVEAIYYVIAAIVIVFLTLSSSVVNNKIKPSSSLASLGVIFYPLLPILVIIKICMLDSPYWQAIIFTGIAASAICDTFALFGGMLFGKHKLAPHISPNKTVEGSISGLIFGGASGIAMYYIFAGSIDISMLQFIIIGAVASTVGQMGDLIASSFKREAGLKDFSNLIPGHGGALDRLDSHLFSICTVYICLLLMNII